MVRIRWGVLLLVLAPAAWADDPKDKPDKPPAEEYKALVKEYQDKYQEFITAYRAAKTDEERQKAIGLNPKPQDYSGRFLKLAQDNPKADVAVDALAWVVQNVRSGPDADKALDLLVTNHIDSPKLGTVCQTLVYANSPDAEKKLRTVLEKSPHKEVQGRACLSLAQYLRNRSARSGGDQARKEVEELFERVADKYADVPYYGTQKLGDAARAELFEIRNLAIGKPAPDIEGEDIDGKKFKLSEYKGKVVVLDFWGHW
jgi:hypothetical protein